jgi:hypothetical protein
LREYSAQEIADFLRQDALPEGVRDTRERRPDPAGSVRDQLAAAGLLAPIPETEDVPTAEELQALEAEVEAWLDALPEPLGLSEAVIADRDGR